MDSANMSEQSEQEKVLDLKDKICLVLVGGKGSGKSFIGDLIMKSLQIPFLSIEPIFMAIRGDRRVDDPSYARDGYIEVEKELTKLYKEHNIVCFETTGASSMVFTGLLENLKQRGCKSIFVAVKAPLVQLLNLFSELTVWKELCLKRIEGRDASKHIPVDVSLIKLMHEMTEALSLDYAAVIDNSHTNNEEHIIKAVKHALHLS